MGFRVLAGMVATATTISWLLPAALSGGWVGGVFTMLLLFVFTPFVASFLGNRLGELRRRRSRDGNLAPLWPILLCGAGGFAFLIPATILFGQALLHILGLAHQVDLLVTELPTEQYWDRNTGGHEESTSISGDYILNGATHHIEFAGWQIFGHLPDVGDTIRVSISPLWPSTVFGSDISAWFMIAVSLGLAALGVLFLRGAIRERRLAG